MLLTNGFAMALTTAWIAHPGGEYDKQDGERKAFVRLAAHLKHLSPRLPLCLTADGPGVDRTTVRWVTGLGSSGWNAWIQSKYFKYFILVEYFEIIP